jgi:hypothetical protein
MMKSESVRTEIQLSQLQGYFSTMSPADYIGCDGSDPENGPWEAWWSGRVAEIPGDFALFVWWHFNAAVSVFMSPAQSGYPEYVLNDPDRAEGDSAKRLASESLVCALRDIEASIGSALSLSRRYEETDFWVGESGDNLYPIRLASAYSLWCIDQCMLALYNNDALSSARAMGYAIASLDLAQEYERTVAGSASNGIRFALRTIGQSGGKAKHAKDPKQVEKKFVRECWNEWQRDPAKYKTKAAFSRDMLEKCTHLVSQKQIEDWCRDWEKSGL